MGQVIDPKTKQPVSDATVILENQGSQKMFFTNEHGYYYASNIPAGVYSVTASFLSNSSRVNGVKVGSDESKQVDIDLAVGVNLTEVQVTEYRIPLLDPLQPEVAAIDRKSIREEGITAVDQIQETLGGAVKIGNEYYVHGARAGSLSYYIDGCKVMGNPDIPICGLDMYTSYTGYIPAKYGDSTGGVVVMETRSYFTEH